MRQSTRHNEARSSKVLPETVRHFGIVVFVTALWVFMTAFVTVPYALERHPGEPAKAGVTLDSRHMS